MSRYRDWLVPATSLVAAAVLIGAGLLARQASAVLASTVAWVDHTRQVDLALERLLSALRDAETGERGYLIVGTEPYLQPYKEAIPRLEAELGHITELTRDNPVQQARIPELGALVARRVALLDKCIELRRTSFDAALRLVVEGEGKKVMDAVRERVALMQNTEAELLAVRESDAAHAREHERTASIALVILAVLLIAILVEVSRHGARELRRSELRLVTTFNSVGDAVLTTDGRGRIERMNAVAEQLTGWSTGEALGQPLDQVFVIVNEKTREPVENPVDKVMREGGIVGLANHTVLISRGGDEIAIEDSAAPIGDLTGSGGVVLVFRDASQSRALERAREASERRFRRIADGMPQIVYVANERGEVEYLNRRWSEYTGKGDAATPVLETAIHQADGPALMAAWQAALKAETPLEASFRLSSRTGEWRWYLTRTVPIRDPETGELHWYGTSTDIHEQILAQNALAEADRRKDEFLATLAHELRNPLAPIRNATHVLRTAPVDSAARPWAAQVIDRQVRIMAALLDDLLDVARITRGTLILQKDTLTLRSIVESALETAQPLITAHSHSLEVRIPEEDVYLEADAVRLTQVLANLLTNAAKYSDVGGRIEVRGGAEGDRVWFAVRDSGIGLDAAVLDYIFGLFAQVSPCTDRAERGLGIGLALVKGLVELHGGSVVATSAGLGKGSEFRVTLPRGHVTSIETEKPESEPAAPAQRKLRVLVADDNVDGAETMAAVLEISGYEVVIAHDGSAALSLAESFRPRVAIVDIGMPTLDGYAVARGLRTRPWADGLFLVAVTGWGQESDRARALGAGFDDHLVKPVEVDSLLALMARKFAAVSVDG